MSEFYVGITVGPIIETLGMASRPASLWCASAMFSWLTEDICNKAIGIGGEIISPYYPDQKKAPVQYSVTFEGVGKYHDRIIFKVVGENINIIQENVDEMITKSKVALANELVKEKVSKVAGHPETLLKNVILNYLQVRYIIEEKKDESGTNCILRLSPYLDAAELCPIFNVDQSIQPIMALFEGKTDNAHNDLVKQCFGLTEYKNSVLDTSKKVRDIASIAASVANSDRKIFDYYAIVQADGDSIGKLLAKLNEDSDVNEFSKLCLNYTSKAASKIREFGGMTIYAGGDDLLFISPLENADGKTIFQLCSEICTIFKESFEGYPEDIKPTLSFGISINYRKFPLYEAFNEALEMLEIAKKVETDDEPKNKTGVYIKKHSGQSVKFRYSNDGEMYQQLLKLLQLQTDVVFLHSMLYKIDLYRPILIAALKNGGDLEQTFSNLFDSGYHKTVMEYIQTVRVCLEMIYLTVKGNTNKDHSLEEIHISKSESEEMITLDLLYSLLRTVKFFSEKRGESNGKISCHT